jgi:hypothetical protein
VLEAALELAGATVLAAVLIAVGKRVCTMCRWPLAASLQVGSHFLLGAGVLSGLLTAAGLAGVLTREVSVGLVAGSALLGRWRRWRWPVPWTLLVLAVPLVLLLPVALAPPFFYDALVYHLGLPWQALLERGWRPHPENLYATMPPLAQSLALPPLAVGWERVPALLHLMSFFAASLLVSGLARSLGAPRWAAVGAGAALPILPILVVMPAFPAAEGWGIAGVVGAAAVALRSRIRPRTAALAAALAGIAAASRAQVAPLAVALTLVAIVRVHPLRRRLIVGGVALLASSPWWLKNLLLLGAPLAPLGWRVGGQEALWQDGRAALAIAGSPAQAAGIILAGVWPGAWYVVALAFCLALPRGHGRGAGRGLLAGVALVGLGAWALLAAVPRYLGATTALLLAFSAPTARRPAGRFVYSAILVATALQGMLGTTNLVARLGGPGLPAEDPGEVRQRLVVNDPSPAFAAAGGLPATARVLFVGEPRGYAFPRRFVAPSYYDSSPLAEVVETAGAPGDIVRWLHGRGFTHLLVNWPELQRLAPGYPVAPWRSEEGRRAFLHFRAGLGPPVVAESGVEIYSLAR